MVRPLPNSRPSDAGRWLRVWSAIVLGALLAVPAARSASAVELPLDRRQVFHLFLVDTRAVAGRETALVDYVLHRWQALTERDAGLNGRIVFLDGPNGRETPFDLSPDQKNQRAALESEVQRRIHASRSAERGIDLTTAATYLTDVVNTRFDEMFDHGHVEEGDRLLMVHLIADNLWRGAGERMWSLATSVFPESCLEEGAAATAASSFDARVAERGKIPGPAPRLRVALILVASSERRFSETTERAAAQVLLGRAAVAGRAIALRDALGCLEVDHRVAPLVDVAGRCRPKATDMRSPARTIDSCPSWYDMRERASDLTKSRLDRDIVPFLDGRPSSSAAPGSSAKKDTDAAQGSAKTTPEAKPVVTTARVEPPTATDPTPPVRSDPPVTSTPKPEVVREKPIPSPPPATPPQVAAPSATPPASGDSKPVASDPAPAPTQSGPTPQVGTGRVETAPPTSARTETGPRIAAITTRSRPNRSMSYHVIEGHMQGDERRVSVHLVPSGQPPKIAAATGVIDLERPVTVLQAPGVYWLVAHLRVSPVCDRQGNFSFVYSLDGTSIEPADGGRFQVSVTNACAGRTADVIFGKVRLK